MLDIGDARHDDASRPQPRRLPPQERPRIGDVFENLVVDQAVDALQIEAKLFEREQFRIAEDDAVESLSRTIDGRSMTVDSQVSRVGIASLAMHGEGACAAADLDDGSRVPRNRPKEIELDRVEIVHGVDPFVLRVPEAVFSPNACGLPDR